MRGHRYFGLGWVIGAVLLCGAVGAELRTEPVGYSDGDTALEGYLAVDSAGSGKRPGVLVVHEWWGLNAHAKRMAEQLAALGYVALAVDMYGKGKVTDTIEEAAGWSGTFKKDPALSKSRFTAALAALRARPEVDAARIGAIGFCFGGTIVLDMARQGVDVKGVVSFHGALSTAVEGPRKIAAKVLVCHGADDPFIPAEELAVFQEEMREAKADWQLVSYGNAVHSFTNPEADARGMAGVKYEARAAARSWEAMKAFFAEVL